MGKAEKFIKAIVGLGGRCMGRQEYAQEEMRNGLLEDDLKQMEGQGSFSITPCEKKINPDNEKGFEKLKLTSGQKMQISGLMQQVPNAVAAGEVASAYMVKFHNGLPHTLMRLKQGGYSTSVIVDGKIGGTASLYRMTAQASVLGAFTAMSVATGQFFLAQINKELNAINGKVDEILQFLYENQRAELASEIKFIEYAYDNYNYIMVNDQQRTATIVGIQEAKKLSIKDQDFYLNMLTNKIDDCGQLCGKPKCSPELIVEINKVIAIERCLNASLQLYLMSSLMEIFYAQNYEAEYIEYIEKDIMDCIKKRHDKMREDFGRLCGYIEKVETAKALQQTWKECKAECECVRESLDKEYNNIHDKLTTVLKALDKDAEYCISRDGIAYYKIPE